MPDSGLITPTLVAVFMLGLGGAVHCVGMCGGVVTAFAQRSPGSTRPISFVSPRGPHATSTSARSPSLGAARQHLAYHAGRLISYTVAGTLAGGIGSAAWFAAHILPLQQIAFALSSLMLMLIGLHLAGVPVLAHWLEHAGARVWHVLQPVARSTLRLRGTTGALLAGTAWGWVPCGMVYGMLTAALMSGDALSGALIALAFGMGTLPGLLSFGWFARQGLTNPPRWLLRATGVAIAMWAVAGLLRIDPLPHLRLLGEACVTWLR